jgi:hypothetical protein
MRRSFLRTIMPPRCARQQLDEGTSYGHWRSDSAAAQNRQKTKGNLDKAPQRRAGNASG